ncbi:hypothetical protein BURMUCF1_3003 [Burkholderia multivorans ATCC BAA-247]|nr:hypothetical protein BURMUCF1_3003 [Burkholderia multivorans ATCC BAA-247]
MPRFLGGGCATALRRHRNVSGHSSGRVPRAFQSVVQSKSRIVISKQRPTPARRNAKIAAQPTSRFIHVRHPPLAVAFRRPRGRRARGRAETEKTTPRLTGMSRPVRRMPDGMPAGRFFSLLARLAPA